MLLEHIDSFEPKSELNRLCFHTQGVVGSLQSFVTKQICIFVVNAFDMGGPSLDKLNRFFAQPILPCSNNI